MLTTCLKTDNLPFLVLGLCPLLLVTTSIFNGLVMGSLFFVTLLLSSLILVVIRHLIPGGMKSASILLVTAGVATLADLLLSAFYYEWHLVLGIYVPLLAMNYLLLMNAEVYALRHGIKKAVGQSLEIGLSVWGILILTGLLRDIMTGSIFNADSFIIFGMAPGAFLVLGLIIALIQYFNTSTAKADDGSSHI